MFGFLKKKPKKKSVKLFFATDIHGSEVVFRKFINAGKFYGVEYLVLGGDITGKLLIPIVQENGTYRTNLQGIKETINTQEELHKITKKIENLGFYWIILTPERVQQLQNDPQERERIFNQLATERLEKWIAWAEEKLKGTGIRCFITGGNDDSPEVLEPLYRHNSENVIASEAKLISVGENHSMIGLGYSNPTPWHTPREASEERLEELIDECLKKVQDFGNCIFNFHVPPQNSTLDLCPKLDTSTDPPTPVYVAGQQVMFGAGSSAVRKAIEKYQPVLVLAGHIHESKGAIKIGRSTVINPGSEYGEGVLRGVIVNLTDQEVIGYQMTSG